MLGCSCTFCRHLIHISYTLSHACCKHYYIHVARASHTYHTHWHKRVTRMSLTLLHAFSHACHTSVTRNVTHLSHAQQLSAARPPIHSPPQHFPHHCAALGQPAPRPHWRRALLPSVSLTGLELAALLAALPAPDAAALVASLCFLAVRAPRSPRPGLCHAVSWRRFLEADVSPIITQHKHPAYAPDLLLYTFLPHSLPAVIQLFL